MTEQPDSDRSRMILTKKTCVVNLGLSLSCRAGVATMNRPSPTIQKTHVKDQEYTMEKRQTAYIGESMVRVKDFLVSQSIETHVWPDQVFVLSKWTDQIHRAQGGNFKISEQSEIGGKHFPALDAWNVAGAHYRLLVEESDILLAASLPHHPGMGYLSIIYPYPASALLPQTVRDSPHQRGRFMSWSMPD